MDTKKSEPTSREVASKLLVAMLAYQARLDAKLHKTKAEERHIERLRFLRKL